MQALFGKIFLGDKVMWSLMIALSLISIIAVYSSTGTLAYMYQDGNTLYYVLEHCMFLVFGFLVAWGIHHIHYKQFAIFARILLIVSIVLLLYALVKGQNINDANRWVRILGFQFQPSEIAKYALVMYVALMLGKYQTVENPPKKAFWWIIAATSAVCGLIFSQNLSTALMIGAVVVTMLIVGRVPIRYILLVGVGTGLIVALVAFVDSKLPEPYVTHRFETWLGRIKPVAEAFNIEIKTEAGDTYQGDMAKTAISTGGFFGRGPGNGIQKHVLPHPYSDFIYAIIVEEGGLIMGVIVLLLYLMILFRTGHIVKQAKSTFPAFLAIGLGLMIFFQAFIHMGVSVGLGPVTGQTLPLISMGGTSILITCAAFGMILSISRFSNKRAHKVRVEDEE